MHEYNTDFGDFDDSLSFKSPASEIEIPVSSISPSSGSCKSTDVSAGRFKRIVKKPSLIYVKATDGAKCLATYIFVAGDGNRLLSSPSSDAILCGVLPKSERPKSLDLSGGQGSLRLTVPHLGSAKQHHLAADRLHGVEEEETETDKQKPVVERSVSCSGAEERPGVLLERSISCSAATVSRTGVIERGFDPLSLMAADAVQECDQENSGTNRARRDLAEEIEMYMNNGNSPLSSRTPSMDLQNPSSPLFRPASSPHTSPRPSTLLHSSTHLPLPVKSKERLRPSPSLPLGVCTKDRERPSSLVSPSSPTPSSSSFSMDSLFTPTLDIFKSSVISAGKGVAEKASRLYSRLSSQTSLTQVGSAAFSPK